MAFRPIVRCVCTDITFAELKESGLGTAEAIAEEFGAGAQCGLCREYIEKMLRTGKTEFSLYPEDPSSEDV
ncbi:(2Fe-2S)-binding protein [bacterium]|nr:MAG: (2Fe-2S)-binding protein [bacterium]